MRLAPYLVFGMLLLAGCASPGPSPSVVAPPPAAEFTQVGLASWYGKDHDGKTTASGERFQMKAMTAAHRSLPFGTIVRVTALATGRSVNVRINDRGPYVGGRIIDLSAAAAARLGAREDGSFRVRLEVFPADQTVARPVP